MKYSATIEAFETFEQVKFYTIRYEDEDGTKQDESETDKFFKRFLIDPETPLESAQIVTKLILEIGKRGAYKRFFRFENKADALPPSRNSLIELGIDGGTNSLRLYCIRLSASVVVLFNGGIKTAQKAQDCPNVSNHFRMANIVADRLDEAIRERDIQVQFKKLVFDSDFELYL